MALRLFDSVLHIARKNGRLEIGLKFKRIDFAEHVIFNKGSYKSKRDAQVPQNKQLEYLTQNTCSKKHTCVLFVHP